MTIRKKISALGVVTSLLLSSVFATPLVVKADSFDEQIAQKQQQLKNLEQSKIEQSSQLKTLLNEQEQYNAQISTLTSEMEKTQKEMSTLMEEIESLEELIEKRRQSIDNQARVLQVTDSVNMYLEAIFASQSVSEAIVRIFTMAEITGNSVDILEQQKKDMASLQQKQLAVHEKAQQQEKTITSLNEAKERLTANILEANQALVDLELAQSTAQEDITRLNAEKEEAIRLAQEQARRQEEQRLAAQRAKEQQAALAKAQEEARLAQQQTSSSTNITQTTQVSTVSQTSGKSGTFSYPLSGASITSRFGARSLTAGGTTTSYHYGVDFVNGNPTSPIYAAGSGTVVFAGWVSSSAGNGVIIKHPNGLYTYYYHLSAVGTSVGASVSTGQQIGNMGSTGRSTGAHLHFGVSTGYFSGYFDPLSVL